jgi:subtilisin-like proprotein convertase family protein
MKSTTLIGMLATLLAAGVARATLTVEETFSGVNAAIPVGNPVGVAITETVSDISTGLTVGSLTVGLNISGGYNGNLFAYLVAPNGSVVTLMNMPGVSVNGFGASGAGMNITLQDGTVANGDIQNETSSSVLSGTYNAAGSLSGFDGSAADGTWTLFFADLGSGGGTSELNSWSLDITAVPEQVDAALAVLLGLLALHWSLGKCWGKSLSKTSSSTTPRA